MNGRRTPGSEPEPNALVPVAHASLASVDPTAIAGRRVFLGGKIPTAALHLPKEAPVATQPDSACSVSFRLLARQVAHLDSVRKVMVTSSAAGEGKTFCSLNLALSLAMDGGAPVLLVEGNLHRPTLAQRIGFTPPRCFGQWLQNAALEPTAPFRAVEVCVPNLHVLAVDPQRTAPSALNSTGFEMAMRQLSFSPYRYIVVDAPEVEGSADAALIADTMDGVVLCAAKGRTKLSRYRDAVKQLEPVPVLAKVLLDV